MLQVTPNNAGLETRVLVTKKSMFSKSGILVTCQKGGVPGVGVDEVHMTRQCQNRRQEMCGRGSSRTRNDDNARIPTEKDAVGAGTETGGWVKAVIKPSTSSSITSSKPVNLPRASPQVELEVEHVPFLPG